MQAIVWNKICIYIHKCMCRASLKCMYVCMYVYMYMYVCMYVKHDRYIRTIVVLFYINFNIFRG